MSYNNGSDIWEWRGQVYSLEDNNTSIEASDSLLNEVDQNVDHISYMFDNESTPVKACNDLPYASNNDSRGKESELYRDHSSQVKRRRMLQFESEVLETPLCNDEDFLRSTETQDSLEAAISDMSQWVAGFTDGISESNDECLDPSSEGWISDCFNEAEIHLNEDFSACGASDVQIDVAEIYNTAPQYEADLVKNSIKTPRNVVFKGTKSYMRTPPKLASSVVYPFAFIKPCGVLGDTTLKDINRRIHNPPKPKPEEESYPKSAFSGKLVVGKTKIQTEGGKGSITIMRTKG